MKWINEYKEGEKIVGHLLVTSAVKGVSENGKPYLNVTLQDRTGSIESKKWDASDEDLEVLAPGKVVFIEGMVNTYKGQPQLKILSVEPIASDANINYSYFQRVSPIPLDELKERLNALLNSFKDKDVELVTRTFIDHFYDKYISYPGAIKIHHEFGSGILHHSVVMAELADKVASVYPSVDRDLLVAGALLHDMGKTIEYTSPLAPQMSLEGKLLGHISIGFAEFRKLMDSLNIQSEVPLLIEHMILSHHGQLDFGSPVLPSTREAVLLSMIDMLDSRMMILDKALAEVKPGEFTQKQWAMDNVSFYKPKER